MTALSLAGPHVIPTVSTWMAAVVSRQTFIDICLWAPHDRQLTSSAVKLGLMGAYGGDGGIELLKSYETNRTQCTSPDPVAPSCEFNPDGASCPPPSRVMTSGFRPAGQAQNSRHQHGAITCRRRRPWHGTKCHDVLVAHPPFYLLVTSTIRVGFHFAPNSRVQYKPRLLHSSRSLSRSDCTNYTTL